MKLKSVFIATFFLVGLSSCSESSSPRKNEVSNNSSSVQDDVASESDVSSSIATSTISYTPGVDVATDAAILGLSPPPSKVSRGMTQPEMGQGEYANPDWKLPEMGEVSAEEAVPADEMPPPLPPGAVVDTPQIMEDIPLPMVEDIPPVQQ